MAVLPIVTVPDPILRKVCKPMTSMTPAVKTLAHDMLDTILYDHQGIGLAANQVGHDVRLVVIRIPHESGDIQGPYFMVNPEITSFSEEKKSFREACLSVPEQAAEVTRPSEITVRYQDLEMKEHTLEAKGLLAICIQHEIDHLNGKIYLDHLPPLKKRLLMSRVMKKKRR